MASISDSYFKAKAKRRKLVLGGILSPEEIAAKAKADADAAAAAKAGNVASGIGLVGGMGSQMVEALANTNEYGRQATGTTAVSGALKGAAAGAALGPLGAVAGGLIGGIGGILSGDKARHEELQMLERKKLQQRMMDSGRSSATLGANPNATTGNLAASYFAHGGKIKRASGGDIGDPTVKPPPNTVKPTAAQLTKEQLTEFANFSGQKSANSTVVDYNTALDNAGLKGSSYLRQPYSRDMSEPGNIEKVQQHWIGSTTAGALARARALNIPGNAEAFKANMGVIYGKDKYGDAVMNDKNFAAMYPNYAEVAGNLYAKRYKEYDPNTAMVKAVVGAPAGATVAIKANGGSLSKRYFAAGGNFKQESSDGKAVNGDSHAEGGIDVPGTNAEVEGGETIKDDYVFSKKLGFADLHKPLMKAKGKIEQKPATPERLNSLRRIGEQEDQLALAQEYFKKAHNLK